MWEEAGLQMAIGNEEGNGIPSTCEYSNEKIIIQTGIEQAVYSFGFTPGSDIAHFEIDSVVILL